jgi:hypothetical protein
MSDGYGYVYGYVYGYDYGYGRFSVEVCAFSSPFERNNQPELHR